jgi:hypothetical protein
MNSYEQKRAERIERLRARAESKRAAGEAAIDRSRERLSRIPFGQPILVGHHSERRHRSDLAKSDRDMRHGVEAMNEASELERRARAAEQSRAVSSDDPDAVDKLRSKLAEVERGCERMKQANAMIRQGATAAELGAMLGWTEDKAARLLERDFAGRIGFPAFALSNERAEARRIKARIEALEARATAPAPAAVEHNGIRIEESDNRVRIVFPAKPDEATRTALKSRGFRWSPTAGAWQRHASNGAWYDAKVVVGVQS